MTRFEWPRHRDKLRKSVLPMARKATDRESFVRRALEQVACRSAAAEQMAADELGDLWDQVHGGRHQGPPAPADVEKLLADAQQLVDHNQFGQAAALYHAAFNMSTFPETGHLMAQSAAGLVHALIGAKQVEDAEHFVHQLQAAAPEAVVPVSLLAQVRSAQKRYAEAIALFQQVQAKTPESPSAHLNTEVALLHLQLGQLAEAEATARAAVGLEAGNVAALKALALVLLRAERWDESQRYLEVARSLDGADEQIDVLLKIAHERTPPAGAAGAGA